MKKVTVENAWFQETLAIKNNKNKRHKKRTFLVEGVKNINSAIKHNWKVKEIIVKDINLSTWANGIIEIYDVPTYQITDSLMSQLSDKENNSELLLLVEMKERNPEQINAKEDLLVVVYDRPVYPGNLGTIMRTCDALKVDALIVTGHSADIYDSTTIRASVGTFFRLPTYKLESHKDIEELSNKLKNELPDLKVVGTTANTDKIITDIDFKSPTILLVGNESVGLTNGYKEISNTLTKIPMYGEASSYNVAVATSMILYEIQRQRGF